MELARAFEIGQQRAMSIRQAQITAASPQVRTGLTSPSDSTEKTAAAQSRRDRDRIGELVGGIFYNTLIKEMQNSNLKSPLFHGGRGEEAFNGQLAAELATRIGRSRQEPVSNAIYRAAFRRHSNG